MPEKDWLLEVSEEAGMLDELRQQRAQQLKEDIAEEAHHEYNYAHEHVFSADVIKARRER